MIAPVMSQIVTLCRSNMLFLLSGFSMMRPIASVVHFWDSFVFSAAPFLNPLRIHPKVHSITGVGC
ncbi:MAG: hypothetical protein ACI4MU_10715 [Candidatus Ventricola sp.]